MSEESNVYCDNSEEKFPGVLKTAGKVALGALLLKGIYHSTKSVAYVVAKAILERKTR